VVVGGRGGARDSNLGRGVVESVDDIEDVLDREDDGIAIIPVFASTAAALAKSTEYVYGGEET